MLVWDDLREIKNDKIHIYTFNLERDKVIFYEEGQNMIDISFTSIFDC